MNVAKEYAYRVKYRTRYYKKMKKKKTFISGIKPH